jgi:hypothetical protein
MPNRTQNQAHGTDRSGKTHSRAQKMIRNMMVPFAAHSVTPCFRRESSTRRVWCFYGDWAIGQLQLTVFTSARARISPLKVLTSTWARISCKYARKTTKQGRIPNHLSIDSTTQRQSSVPHARTHALDTLDPLLPIVLTAYIIRVLAERKKRATGSVRNTEYNIASTHRAINLLLKPNSNKPNKCQIT